MAHKPHLQKDMYRIYGINKPELGYQTASNTPKTSSGKREASSHKNQLGIRVNYQMVSNRVNQHTSQGNRSVSPNRIAWQDPSDKEMFAHSKKTNIVDILKFQARTNLKSLEKDMSSVIGRRKKMAKKKKLNKTGFNLYAFRKPTPTHKRVKTNIMQRDPILAVHHPSPLNRNNYQMEGVKGHGYTQAPNTFNRHKDSNGEQNRTFTRNQSKKKYREGSSESQASNSYLKSFDSKRFKKKKKVKKVFQNSGIPDAFLN